MKDVVMAARAKIEEAEYLFTHEILAGWNATGTMAMFRRATVEDLQGRMDDLVADLCSLEDEIDEAAEDRPIRLAPRGFRSWR